MPRPPVSKLKLAGVEFRLVCFTSTDRKNVPHVNIEPGDNGKWLIVGFDSTEDSRRPRRYWSRDEDWVREAVLRDKGVTVYPHNLTYEWAEVEAEVARAIANLTGLPLKSPAPPPKGPTHWARLSGRTKKAVL